MTSGQKAHRARIDDALAAWMADPRWDFDEDRFDRLARELFAYQFEQCPAYARFCSARGVEPQGVDSWRQIPAVPAGAFKEVRLACFAEDTTIKTFRTSGTSQARRGELHLDTLELYEASLTASLAM